MFGHFTGVIFYRSNAYEPSREKTNIVDSVVSIDPDQPKYVVQANPDRHFSPSVDFVLGIITL